MNRKISRLILVLLMLVATACQQTNQNQSQHLSQIKNDFASGINVVLDYVSDGSRTFIICDVDNPQGRFIDLWLIQQNETLGQRTSSERRFYTGNQEITQKTFRVPVQRAGITETIRVDVFDQEGQLVMSTEPITNTKEVLP